MNEPAKRAAVKRDVTSLRSTIEWLRAEGDLVETDKEVNPDLEITGLQKHFDGSIPILFNNVKGKPHARAITNLFSNIQIVDKMFGFDGPVDRTRKLAHALNRPIKSIMLEGGGAPCQEHVITGEQRARRRHAEAHGDRDRLVVVVMLGVDLPHVRPGRDLESADVAPAEIHAVVAEVAAAVEIIADDAADP